MLTLEEVKNKTCLIGLSYFDVKGGLLKQSQLCGTVIGVSAEDGISIELMSSEIEASNTKPDVNKKPAIFMLPPALTPWFSAPAGNYKDSSGAVTVENPDYLVTWDIHQTRDDTQEGQHTWWEWKPNTVSPKVG